MRWVKPEGRCWFKQVNLGLSIFSRCKERKRGRKRERVSDEWVYQHGTCSGTFLMKQRLSSLRALIFMTHGNFDTEKVSVTFSCVRIFYFSRKLQSGNDLINACFLGCSLRACQFGAAQAVKQAQGWGGETDWEKEGEMQTTPRTRPGFLSFYVGFHIHCEVFSVRILHSPVTLRCTRNSSLQPLSPSIQSNFLALHFPFSCLFHQTS